MTNYGAWAGLISVLIIYMAIVWRIKSKIKKEVKVIENVEYPKKEESRRTYRDIARYRRPESETGGEFRREIERAGGGEQNSDTRTQQIEDGRGHEKRGEVQDKSPARTTPDSGPDQSGSTSIPYTEPLD